METGLNTRRHIDSRIINEYNGRTVQRDAVGCVTEPGETLRKGGRSSAPRRDDVLPRLQLLPRYRLHRPRKFDALHAVREDHKARFPLPELTGDRFPLPVLTGNGNWSPVNSGRQLG